MSARGGNGGYCQNPCKSCQALPYLYFDNNRYFRSHENFHSTAQFTSFGNFGERLAALALHSVEFDLQGAIDNLVLRQPPLPVSGPLQALNYRGGDVVGVARVLPGCRPPTGWGPAGRASNARAATGGASRAVEDAGSPP